ncbi:hypothetical protein DPMN_073731 [Dreissena polymorpha]|uniref:Uncharacterized protein n=1 Tax=Dreissena polymorpha TaxID=45954 RepID=A0A9D4BZN0_DREPO|nr:hypothetical protein DPMN_073731 [Dreissena polymorpha]
MPGQQPISVWGSHDYHYMSSQYPALYPQPSSQTSNSYTNILDLNTGATRAMTPLARSSPSLTANRSQGYTAAATEKTTYSPNVSDFVSHGHCRDHHQAIICCDPSGNSSTFI